MSFYEELKERGLIKDVAGDEEVIKDLLDNHSISFYWGTYWTLFFFSNC